MKNGILILVMILIVGFCSCKHRENRIDNSIESTHAFKSGLQLDHVNVWVEKPEKAKERLVELGFSTVPDSLSQVHHGQGTAGRYFHFLNAYLEFIFVNKQVEFDANCRINKDLDFEERANFAQNAASPFSIALRIEDYEVDKIPFKTVCYHQDWMKDGACIYSAQNSKTHLAEPSVFVVYPEIEAERFNTLTEVETIPEEYAFARDFYKHPNKAQKLTQIIITSKDLAASSQTLAALNDIEGVKVKKGKEHLMELYFDKQAQGQSFDLRPELPLIIYL